MRPSQNSGPLNYLLPPLATDISIVRGRFNSKVSWVPEGSVAERCLDEPVSSRGSGPDRSSDQYADWPPGQSANQHPACRTAALFDRISPVVR